MMQNDLTSQMIQDKLSASDPWYQLVMKMLGSVTTDFHGWSMIEVGCGFGGFAINVAKRGGSIVGLDVSTNAVHIARDLAEKRNLQDKVDLVVGDAQHIPFKEESADIVVCSETLEHVLDYEKAFGELSRIACRSGYLCLTVPNFLSTAFFENVILLIIGQPNYVKSNLCVDKEHIFHIFKLRKLLRKEKIDVLIIRSVDFLHLPPRVRRVLRLGESLRLISEKLETLFEKYVPPLRLMGANIGVLARKE